MRSNFLLLLFFTGFLFFAHHVSAQTISVDNLQKLKVNQLSDQQILEVWKRFQASGLSEADAMRILAQRGLPATEAEEFKRRLALLQGGAKTTQKPPPAVRKDSVDLGRDSLKLTEAPVQQKGSLKYGYDFFNNPNLKFEPNIRIATPKNYVLGADDELNILLTGLNEASISGKISPDGNMKIPYVGLVYLNGYTIEQAYARIKSQMQKIYPALRSGTTQLTVNLGTVRSIRVTIIGEAAQPGTYTISSLSTLFNALYLAGGPSEKGSLRYIEIIRGNKLIRTVDFYTFLQKGIMDGNIRLEDQDVVRIPVYKKRVAIGGEVNRVGLYELRENETLQDLIQYAGGLSDLAYKSGAKIIQVDEKEKSVKDVPANMFDRFILKNADSVYFEPVLNRFTNRVVIEGAVYRPGVFELSKGLTLKQLIEKADGLRDDAFLSGGYIKRTQPDLDKQMVSFDLASILSGKQPDIPLLREDSVMIASTQNLKDEPTITMEGYVRSPGTFVYREGLNIADVIVMAGGFATDAANHRIEISRLELNRSDTLSNKLLDIISLNVDSSLKTTGSRFALQPFDYIYVPRLVNYRSLGNVKIRGEVLFPGDYALQRRDETAPEFIKRAGGLTPTGSLANAKVYRDGVRVDIDLSGRIKRQSRSALILLAGDSISVPREVPFVEVSGEINNAQLLRYTGREFKYYINSAGGVKETGQLKNAYIQYANGLNRPVKRFLFFRNYPTVTPGSKIIVPQKAPSPFKIGFNEIGAVTSVLTAVVTLITVLSR